MSLKFPFKFIHAYSGDEYLANQDINCTDKVVVSWVDDAGHHNRRYPLSDLELYIKNKAWVIIEQLSPFVSITQYEYDSMVEEINLLQELLAEANNRIVEMETKSKFKPVKDMTFDDWKQAKEKGHKFKTRCGHTVSVHELDDCSIWSVLTENGWHRVDGTFDSDREEVAEDIIERIS